MNSSLGGRYVRSLASAASERFSVSVFIQSVSTMIHFQSFYWKLFELRQLAGGAVSSVLRNQLVEL
jgi:hypothetical protein